MFALAIPFDERERERIRNLRRSDTTLPERGVEDGFQLHQALFGPAHKMQSYYGSLLAAKRFEVTLCERELQLPEGMLDTLPLATGKRPWPRAGRAHSWKRGSATLADRRFPEGLEVSPAWVAARCLRQNSASAHSTFTVLNISISCSRRVKGSGSENTGPVWIRSVPNQKLSRWLLGISSKLQ